MKLFRLVVTMLLFFLPALSLEIDKSGTLCWIICLFYLYLHLFFFQYVRLTHHLDKINTPLNFTVK